MRDQSTKLVTLAFLSLLSVNAVLGLGLAPESESCTSPQIPRTWDDEAVAEVEVTLANPAYSPAPVTSDYDYLAVRHAILPHRHIGVALLAER